MNIRAFFVICSTFFVAAIINCTPVNAAMAGNRFDKAWEEAAADASNEKGTYVADWRELNRIKDEEERLKAFLEMHLDPEIRAMADTTPMRQPKHAWTYMANAPMHSPVRLIHYRTPGPELFPHVMFDSVPLFESEEDVLDLMVLVYHQRRVLVIMGESEQLEQSYMDPISGYYIAPNECVDIRRTEIQAYGEACEATREWGLPTNNKYCDSKWQHQQYRKAGKGNPDLWQDCRSTFRFKDR